MTIINRTIDCPVQIDDETWYNNNGYRKKELILTSKKLLLNFIYSKQFESFVKRAISVLRTVNVDFQLLSIRYERIRR